jgi:hypothetical protein
VWARIYTCGTHVQYCVHMCRMYVAGSGGDRKSVRPVVASTLHPCQSLSGPLPFHMCCFWRQTSKGRDTEMLTHRATVRAVWVRVNLCKWFAAVRVIVGCVVLSVFFFFFFFLTIKYLFYCYFWHHLACFLLGQGNIGPSETRFMELGSWKKSYRSSSGDS